MRILDLLAVVLFLAGMAGMGVWFARKNTSTEAYFLGNRSFPGWAIGISMLGTSISSVTFLAIPAAAYVLDYRQAVTNLALPFVAAEFVIEVAMGILMKLIPQMHVFVINIQLKILVGIFLLLAFAQPIGDFMDRYMEAMLHSVETLLTLM